MRKITLTLFAFSCLSLSLIFTNLNFMPFLQKSLQNPASLAAFSGQTGPDFPRYPTANDYLPKQRLLEGTPEVPEGYLELFSLPFVGTWVSNEPQGVELLDKFEKTTGKLRFDFNGAFQKKNRLIWFEEPSSSILLDKLQMLIIDGQYNNDKLQILPFENSSISNLDLKTNTLTIYENNTTFDLYQPCDIILNLDFNNIITPDPTTYYKGGTINVKMTSENCTMNLEGTLHIDTFDYSSKFFYNVLLRLILLYNSWSNLKLALRAIHSSPERERISLLTPVSIAIWDMVFLSNMYIPPDFGPTELSKAILFLEMLLYEASPSFLLLVPFWRRTQGRGNYLNGAHTHKTLWLFVFLPTVIMILFIGVAVQAFYKPAFLFVMSLYLMPQIVHNIMRGSPMPFELENIRLMISLRPLLPLYIKGYSWNIFQVQPSKSTALIVWIILGAQAGILYLQAKYGARFFIPKFKKLEYHDYLDFPSRDSSQGQAIELLPVVKVCKICMEPLKDCPVYEEGTMKNIKPVLERLAVEAKKVVRTECTHKFHAGCLVEWMMIKMECPKCGLVLKPLE